MLVRYVRDQSRRRIGVVVAVPRDHDYGIGWSLCHVRKDGKPLDRFDKEMGLKIATGRAAKCDMRELIIPHKIRDAVAEMDSRAYDYYKQFTK